eukprot:TRINITY_DN3271_c0_g1_i4.p1 TRINITY_DN3271_c0_g1~~TRINITY_DN3271_c0_g1_i4.p1  ORF type:complete len:882 (-),score=357.07 TRINITY_DN3271_c0_g1_i4:125-2770(-)
MSTEEEIKQIKQKVLEDVSKQLDEAKTLLPKPVFNKDVFKELENFYKLKQDLEGDVKTLKGRIEEIKLLLLQEVENFASTYKNRVDGVREIIESKATTSGEDQEQKEKKLDEALAQVESRLSEIPPPLPLPDQEDLPTIIAQLNQELTVSKEQLKELNQQVKQVNSEISELKQQIEEQEHLEKLEATKLATETDRTKRLLIEEQTEKKQIEKELNEMKERLQELEAAQAAKEAAEAAAKAEEEAKIAAQKAAEAEAAAKEAAAKAAADAEAAAKAAEAPTPAPSSEAEAAAATSTPAAEGTATEPPKAEGNEASPATGGEAPQTETPAGQPQPSSEQTEQPAPQTGDQPSTPQTTAEPGVAQETPSATPEQVTSAPAPSVETASPVEGQQEQEGARTSTEVPTTPAAGTTPASEPSSLASSSLSGSAIHTSAGKPLIRTTGFVTQKSLEISWYDIKIVKRIGGGGFAEVFEGVFHGERVAVKKLISQSWDQEGRKELEKEVFIMANSHSSYIVQLYGFNLYPPHMCVVMEFFPRGSLAYILWDKNIQVPWQRRWSFARDAAFALNYLHTRNPPILHRDIKAGNFLVTSDWKLKLTDFGCSTVKGIEEKKSTEEGKEGKEEFIGGTFQWTAPEVLSGDVYTERADVYSYAMVLFEIASRKQPWDEFQAPDEQLKVRQWVGEGKRPAVPSDTPEDFKKLMEAAWEGDTIKRVTMGYLVKAISRKLFLESGEEDEEKPGWVEEKAKILDEIEDQKRLKEELEKKFNQAQNDVEKEKRKKMEYEQRSTETEAKLEGEKSGVRSLQRLVDELDRRYNTEKTKALDASKKMEDVEKKYQVEKKKSEKLQKSKEDSEAELEELTKKYDQEKKKRMDLQRELINHGVTV